jgi:hypothetical protein
MINDFKLKGLIVGRIECGLEEKYGDKIKHQLINLSFKNVSALNMEIKITF